MEALVILGGSFGVLVFIWFAALLVVWLIERPRKHERCLRRIDMLERELFPEYFPVRLAGTDERDVLTNWAPFFYDLQGKVIEVYPGAPLPRLLSAADVQVAALASGRCSEQVGRMAC